MEEQCEQAVATAKWQGIGTEMLPFALVTIAWDQVRNKINVKWAAFRWILLLRNYTYTSMFSTALKFYPSL